ncbi:DNA mismatch repair protein MutS, partial [bacterium]|nr:DNA mismatch repair protein MutS [bacterium]
ATHYHELTELAMILPRVTNYNVAVKEWGDNIVFLRRIVEGGCDHSYGIQVAKLAGLPGNVINRAREILSNLEANEFTSDKKPKLALSRNGEPSKSDAQLDIFEQKEQMLTSALHNLKIEEMTPLDALVKLSELKNLINGA